MVDDTLQILTYACYTMRLFMSNEKVIVIPDGKYAII